MNLGAARRGWLNTRSRREAATFYLFISPWLIGFLLFTVGIIIVGLLITFSNYDGLMPLEQVKLWGFRNYERLATDSKLSGVLLNTLWFTLVAVPLGIAVQLGLAILLNRKGLRGKGIFRTLFYIPSIMPLVAVVIAFQILFDKNTGLINAALSLIVPGTAINWRLGDNIRWVLIMLSVWASLGSGMVIFLAGLQGIPQELKEAAHIDGANTFQVFRKITVPLLSPVIFFQLIIGIIFSMQVLMQPLLLSAATSGYGGRSANLSIEPIASINMWNNHAVYEIFGNGRYGYGVILLWIMFILVALLAVLVFWSSRYWVYYDNQ